MFTFGFYNSLNGDRRYSAEQMGSIFDGIIEDGVFSNVGEMFAVVPGVGLQVIVKTGRAWFDHTWNLNDTWMTLDLDPADILRSRIDSVVLEVNSDQDVRENSIKIVKGTPAGDPVAPTMVHTNEINQYRLADVTIRAAATNITTADIAIKVGMDETPFVYAPMKAMDLTDWFNQWDGQFQEWFANIQAQLEGDVAANLQKQIDDRVKIEDNATEEDIKLGTPGKWLDAKFAKDNVIGASIGDIVFSTRNLEQETSGVFLACDQRKITQEEYPELWDNEFIKYRIPSMFNPNYNTWSMSRYQQNALTSSADINTQILDGFFYKGYVYKVSYDTSNIGIYRQQMIPQSASVETLLTIPYSPTGYFAYGGVSFFSNDYMFVLPIYGTQWFRVDIINKSYTSFSGSEVPYRVMQQSLSDIHANRRDDGGIDILIRTVQNNNSSSLYNNIIYLSYSSDMATRTSILVVDSNYYSTSKTYRFSLDSLSSVYAFKNKYSRRSYSIYNGHVAFTISTSPTVNLYYKSPSDGSFSNTALSYSSLGLSAFEQYSTTLFIPIINEKYIILQVFNSLSKYNDTPNSLYALVVLDINTKAHLKTEIYDMKDDNSLIHCSTQHIILSENREILHFINAYNKNREYAAINLDQTLTAIDKYSGSYLSFITMPSLCDYKNVSNNLIDSTMIFFNRCTTTYENEKGIYIYLNVIAASGGTTYYNYTITLMTDHGPITIRNYIDVDNIVALIEYADYYILFDIEMMKCTVVKKSDELNYRLLPYITNGYIKAK